MVSNVYHNSIKNDFNWYLMFPPFLKYYFSLVLCQPASFEILTNSFPALLARKSQWTSPEVFLHWLSDWLDYLKTFFQIQDRSKCISMRATSQSGRYFLHKQEWLESSCSEEPLDSVFAREMTRLRRLQTSVSFSHHHQRPKQLCTCLFFQLSESKFILFTTQQANPETSCWGNE